MADRLLAWLFALVFALRPRRDRDRDRNPVLSRDRVRGRGTVVSLDPEPSPCTPRPDKTPSDRANPSRESS